MGIQEIGSYEAPLPLLSLNHVSILCRSVLDSMRFYEEILGFGLIKRPSSFKFNGAWLVPIYFASLPFSLWNFMSITLFEQIFNVLQFFVLFCRLYNYGFGIHLLENPNYDEFDTPMSESRPINPKDNHISFQVINLCILNF